LKYLLGFFYVPYIRIHLLFFLLLKYLNNPNILRPIFAAVAQRQQKAAFFSKFQTQEKAIRRAEHASWNKEQGDMTTDIMR